MIPDRFAAHLDRAEHALVGGWVCSGSPLIAEIMAGSGFDWVFIDAEHSPNSLESILGQLYAIGGMAVPVVRPPVNDRIVIKRYLDLGVQNLIIPMVDTAEEAGEAVAATRYPPEGVRGVGAALARSARWNRVPQYLDRAAETITVIVQIESAEGVRNAEAIARTEGVDGVFIGPADLAASMGLIGRQRHPDVVAAIDTTIDAARRAGKKVGINAFDRAVARSYVDDGRVDFVAVGADVGLLARAAENLAAEFHPSAVDAPRASY